MLMILGCSRRNRGWNNILRHNIKQNELSRSTKWSTKYQAKTLLYHPQNQEDLNEHVDNTSRRRAKLQASIYIWAALKDLVKRGWAHSHRRQSAATQSSKRKQTTVVMHADKKSRLSNHRMLYALKDGAIQCVESRVSCMLSNGDA